MKINSHKELIVWQKAMSLVKLIYNQTESFPKQETFGLTSQMRRCAISIPSNIAEGFGRNNIKEYIQFLYISVGSCMELQTQILISKDIYGCDISTQESLLNEIIRMLYSLIAKLKDKKTNT